MTIYEAFRNRGLLVPELQRPVYRVTYGFNRYDKRTVEFETKDWRTAKEELQEKWSRYATQSGIPEDAVIDIHCVANGGLKERAFRA